MTNQEIGTRITERRKEIDITMDELANRVGVAKSTIQRYEAGKISKIKMPVIESIANAMCVNPCWLIGKSETKFGRLPSPALENMEPYNPTHKIPILGRISAGLPLYAEQNIEGYTYTDLNGGAEYFALKVSGDSMTAARIHDGDTLIVRRQEVVENGQIAVVMVGDDEATVKRFYQNGTTVTLMPQSTNPVHQPQIYDTQITNISIVGLVVKNEIVF